MPDFKSPIVRDDQMRSMGQEFLCAAQTCAKVELAMLRAVICLCLASLATFVTARETVEDAGKPASGSAICGRSERRDRPARLARRLLSSTGIGTLATVFADDHPTLGGTILGLNRRSTEQHGLGEALALMEYYAGRSAVGVPVCRARR